jgi:anti-anti-sigma factor
MSHDQDLIIVESFEQGSVVRVLAESLLDPMGVDAIKAQLGGALEAADPPNLVVALDTVSMMSSLMLSVLISLREDAQARGGDVVFAAPSKRIRELFEVTQLDRTFAIHATVEEALASLG